MAAQGNGRVSIRSSRGPSLLVVGLVIASLVLFYGYWSVSSRNSQLLKDVNILQDRLRVLAAQKVAADKKNSALTSQMEQQSRTLKGNLEGERRAREDEKAQLTSRVQELMQGGKDKDDKLARLEYQQDKHKTEIAQLNKFVTNSTQSLKLLADKAAKVIHDHKALNEKYQKTLSNVKTLEREKDECHDALAKVQKAQEASSSKKSDDAKNSEKKENKKNEEDEGSERKDEDKNQESKKDEQEQEQDQKEEESKGETPSQEELTNSPLSVTKRSAIPEDASEGKGASSDALSPRLDEAGVKRDAKIGDQSDASLPSEKEDDRKQETSDKENDGEQQEKNDSEEQEGDKRNDSVENKENDSKGKEHNKENDSEEQDSDKVNDSEEQDGDKVNDSEEQDGDKVNDSEERDSDKVNDSEEQDGDKENDSEEKEHNKESDSKEQEGGKVYDSEERKDKEEDSPFDSSKVGQQDTFGQGNFEDQEEEDEGESDMRKSVNNIAAQSSWSNNFK